MESMTNKASNYDEFLVSNSVPFSDSLKDLKNLSKQLYSAAEYFEQSYSKKDQQQIVVTTLQEYVSKSMINTIDHLGSVAYRMNMFLDEKAGEVTTAEFHVSCLEQRLRTLENVIDWSGFSKESFLVKTPKYHKQYKIPDTDTGKEQDIEQCDLLIGHNSSQSKNDVLATKVKLHSLSQSDRKVHLPSLNSSAPGVFSFTRITSNEQPEKRLVSPLRFSLKRSNSNCRQQYPPELKNSTSLINCGGKEMRKEIQSYSKKSKPLYKTLATMYKNKKDARLSRYAMYNVQNTEPASRTS